MGATKSCMLRRSMPPASSSSSIPIPLSSIAPTQEALRSEYSITTKIAGLIRLLLLLLLLAPQRQPHQCLLCHTLPMTGPLLNTQRCVRPWCRRSGLMQGASRDCHLTDDQAGPQAARLVVVADILSFWSLQAGHHKFSDTTGAERLRHLHTLSHVTCC